MDGHVHFYPAFRRGIGLDAATSAFRAARRVGGDAEGGSNCLVVVDPAGVDGFGRISRVGASGWSVDRIDRLALRAVRGADEATVLLVAGRQIVTESGLEVLAFFMRDLVAEGLSLPRTVEAVLGSGGVPVVPWGFGKWWGRRGRRIEALLRSSLGGKILIADSSVRPRLMPEPGAFGLARELGVPIIAGSDPLPFRGQEKNIGRYGFILDGGLDPADPTAALKARFVGKTLAPDLYGRREDPLAAAGLQMAMQARRFRLFKDGA